MHLSVDDLPGSIPEEALQTLGILIERHRVAVRTGKDHEAIRVEDLIDDLGDAYGFQFRVDLRRYKSEFGADL